jgi:hypothetical protein
MRRTFSGYQPSSSATPARIGAGLSPQDQHSHDRRSLSGVAQMIDTDLAFNDQGEQEPVTQFDYDAIEGAREAVFNREDRAMTVEHVMRFLASPQAVEYFGKSHERKIVALAWILNPGQFDGRSLASLAREHGVTPQAMSHFSANAARIFGLRNRSQRAHGSRWKKRKQHQAGV